MAAACTQGKSDATREAPWCGRDDQPDAGNGQAGRNGVAERLLVPGKPGNAGGGKEPQFKTDAASSEVRLGNLNNSPKCSETADGVTRESKA